MEWVLLLGHAVLGALLLVAARTGAATRRRAIEGAAAAGTGLALALAGAGAAGGRGWRSVALEPATAVPAALAVAGAWILTGALGARGARVELAALTGAASSGLVLAATGRFVVPALLFWLCSSAALAALCGFGGARGAWPALALSDAAVCAAAVTYVVSEDSWSFGGGAEGPVLWALALAAAVRGATYLSGPAAAAGSEASAAAPLMAGGAVALVVRAGGPAPWAAVIVLALAALGLGRVLWKGQATTRIVAGWPVAMAVAACFAAPAQAPLAGAVAALGVTAAALMPFTGTRGGFERGLLVAAVPLTAGFGVVAAAATTSFERATEASTALSSAPWTAVAALLPVALAGGVVLGARAARTTGRELVPEAVLATWTLLLLSVLAGLAPGALGGGDTGLGDSGGSTALFLVALAAGVAAVLAMRRWDVTVDPPGETLPALPLAEDALPPPLVWAGAFVAAGTIATAGWLTVWGLRVGFL